MTAMKISQYYSDKIKVMSFISIVFVIFIHAPYTEAATHPLALAVQRLLTDCGLAIFAVPLFFAISGMLFFNGIEKCGDCFPKMYRRVFSLLIPYLIWNLIFVGWYAVMEAIPGVAQFVNSDICGHLMQENPIAILDSFFVQPEAFHLWFLRDLMLYVLLSPLLYMGLRRFPRTVYVVLLVCLGWMPRLGVTYFVLGGIVAVHFDLDKIAGCLTKKVVVVLLMLYVSNAIAAFFGMVHPESIFYQYYVQVVGTVAILAVWGCYDLLVSKKRNTSVLGSKILSYTFFIYLFHEPAFNIIKKVGLKLLGIHDWSLIGLFLVNPFMMVVFAIGVGMLFRRLLPRVYSLCVGGR